MNEITLAEKRDFLQYLRKISNSLEKIAEKELPKESNGLTMEDLISKENIHGSITLLQPGMNLSQWRVVSLKRIEEALDMINEVLEHSPYSAFDNYGDNIDIPIPTNKTYLSLSRKFFEQLKNTLRGIK